MDGKRFAGNSLAALLLIVLPAAVVAAETEYVTLPGGSLRSALKYGEEVGVSRIAPFSTKADAAPSANAR